MATKKKIVSWEQVRNLANRLAFESLVNLDAVNLERAYVSFGTMDFESSVDQNALEVPGILGLYACEEADLQRIKWHWAEDEIWGIQAIKHEPNVWALTLTYPMHSMQVLFEQESVDNVTAEQIDGELNRRNAARERFIDSMIANEA